MTTRKNSYIGVTGYVDSANVHATLAIPLSSDRLIMIGVLSSRRKTIEGTASFPNRYPEPAHIKNIFVNHPHALNLVHYNTNDQPTLPAQLEQLIELGGPHLHGFQLNMAWPKPELIAAAAKKVERIVLQIGGLALKKANSPQKVIERLKPYQGIITDVLFDPSGGRGQPLNPAIAEQYLSAITEEFPNLGIGAAGGLSSTTLHLVGPLLQKFPQLSIDVEGRVRDGTPDDRMVMGAVTDYVRAADTLITL